ncbi:hypothetical protein [Roseovarius sp. M141]|uniref:hypothetical protein n=1 Tax=Roseovarius sp. M141 TaxID=2583806 RepID=UPI0020CE01F7|nr:hypothetical protein [Roseovarius sp. M141]
MSMQHEDIDQLDEKFERPWQDDFALERKLARDVAEVIRSFVKKSSQTRIAWRKHQVELESILARGERPRERDMERLGAYRHIFDDLPERVDGACATRDVHRKTHGCYRARVTISEDLDPALAKGLFIPGRDYDAVVRFSNGNPRNQSAPASGDHKPFFFSSCRHL